MPGTGTPPAHIIVTPLGSTVDIIQAPLDKWNPEIIFAFSSMPESVERVKENLRYAWSENCGPNGSPEIRMVNIDKPWESNTIEDVMAAFNEMVDNTRVEFNQLKRQIKWHVSITGGTNLMAIGMAFSAKTHGFPVYYSVPGDKHPELRSKPSKLIVDIPLFTQLGPAVSLFRKSHTKVKLFKLIHEAPRPLSVERIAKDLDKTKTAIYAQIKPLINAGVLKKSGSSTYISTTPGILAYHQWQGND
jgi:hypothetical protein